VNLENRVFRSAVFLLVIALLLVAGRPAISAENVGAVTIMDGDAVAIRGLYKFGLARGVRMKGDDLVETGKAGFVRIEFFDGSQVNVGPSTRLQLNRPALRRFDRPTLYLLSGWLKVGAGKAPEGAPVSLSSPPLDVLDLSGSAVVRIESGAVAVFAESGSLRLIDRRARPTTLSVKSGHFVTLQAGEAPRVERAAPPDFVSAMPHLYMDQIPPEIEHVKEVAAKPLGTFSYNEVEAWLNAEPAIRRRFVVDWAAKAEDPAFRDRLETRLAQHPEWEKVLYRDRPDARTAAPPHQVVSTPETR
jgi:hypothetical protein